MPASLEYVTVVHLVSISAVLWDCCSCQGSSAHAAHARGSLIFPEDNMSGLGFQTAASKFPLLSA